MDASSFQFPYEPYPIQLEFMQNLYRTLEEKKIGIFESPTGTGKSLSLLCGSLKWLKDNPYLPTTTIGEETPRKLTGIKWIDDNWKEEQKRREEAQIAEQTRKLELQKRRLKRLRESQFASLKNERSKVFTISKKSNLKRKMNDHYVDEFVNMKKTKRENEVKDDNNDNDNDNNDAEIDMIDKDEVSKIVDEFLLEEYISDEEDQERGTDFDDLHTNTSDPLGGEDDNLDALFPIRKIYYASRTHSQLSQFVNEIKKTKYADDLKVVYLGSRKNYCIHKKISQLSSLNQINEKCLELQKNIRKNKINTDDRNDDNDDDGKSKKERILSRCEYYRDRSKQTLLSDHILAEISEIEDIIEKAKRFSACPYYSSRSSVPSAEIVLLPYNMLLHEESRSSLGIEIKDNIIVIDEAHNLIETINSIHTVEITALQIISAHSQLQQYLHRYVNRLKPKNCFYIRNLIFILSCFIQYLHPTYFQSIINSANLLRDRITLSSSSSSPETNDNNDTNDKNDTTVVSEENNVNNIVDSNKPIENNNVINNNVNEDNEDAEEGRKVLFALNEFLFELKIDHFNFFKIDKFIDRTELIKKLHGFVAHIIIIDDDELSSASSSDFLPSLTAIKSFLKSLTNVDIDGRIVVTHFDHDRKKSAMKYILLNPEKIFKPIVESAHSVILAGGTLHPISDFVDALFDIHFSDDRTISKPAESNSNNNNNNEEGRLNSSSSSRIEYFTFGHIVPKENLIAMSVRGGPSGAPFDFTYHNRNNLTMELGNTINNMCNVVPDGMIIFFPSYSYLETVVKSWKNSKLIDKIALRKKVFYESNDQVSLIANEDVFVKYKAYLSSKSRLTHNSKHGAILLCVINGKLSEGINFSDELGRCVVIVGVPFPNPNDPLIKEKLKYYSSKKGVSASSRGIATQFNQSEYLENMSMKSVNQAIGRAIRHKDDYAAIVLLDGRYTQQRLVSKLPQWIRDRHHSPPSFGKFCSSLRMFFANKEKK